MIEIPESHTIAKQLDESIQGKVITNVVADSSPHRFAFYFGDPKLYEDLLVGKIVGGTKAFGGLIETSVGNAKIVFGDGVNIRYLENGKPMPKKHQLYIEFEDLSAIVCTVQMYGGIWAFVDGQNDNPYYIVAKEKISPLSEEFNIEYFKNIINNVKPNISIKALLATEQRIPGLGNGILQDILFNAGINPKTKISSLSNKEIDKLFKSVKEIIFQMTSKGGRDTEKDLFGNNGGYKTILSKKTIKDPCPVCGEPIMKQAYMGGSIYYCSICQPIE